MSITAIILNTPYGETTVRVDNGVARLGLNPAQHVSAYITWVEDNEDEIQELLKMPLILEYV